jgi:hypothetical protein
MTSEEIVNQINSYIHRGTNLLSDNASFSASVNSNTLTVALGSDDGFSDGQVVSIQNTPVLVPLDSVALNGDGSYTVTTQVDHDLTRDPLIAKETVTIEGWPDGLINGVHDLVNVLNRRTFIITLGDSTNVSGSDGFLQQPTGINGFYEIFNVTSGSFEISLGRPQGVFDTTGTVHSKFRVSASADISRFANGYTETRQNVFWLCVVPNGLDVSRDRTVQNDSVNDDFDTVTEQKRVVIIERFSVFAFIPSSFEIAGRAASDAVQDLRVQLYKSLAGYKPKKAYANNYDGGVSPVGDSVFGYLKDNTAYVHQFNFEVVTNLITGEGGDFFVPRDDVAFRDIDMSQGVDNSINSLTASINLDEDPING